MEPAITIIEYLWDARNTWLKHHDECDCPFEVLSENFLDTIMAKGYSEIVVTDEGPVFVLLRMSAHEWDELCGPTAQKKLINEQVTALMDKASELIALQSTYDRFNG